MAYDEVSDSTTPETSRTFPSMMKRPVALQTVDAIKQMIIEGQLRPAQALPAERVLADALNISRPTLREAIGALTAMNILEPRHGDGTFVTSHTINALQTDLVPAPSRSREPQIPLRGPYSKRTRRAWLPTDHSKRAEGMRALVTEGAVALGDDAEFARLDGAFHARIVEAVRNPLFTVCMTASPHYRSKIKLGPPGMPQLVRSCTRTTRQLPELLVAALRPSARTTMLLHLAHIEEAKYWPQQGALEPEREKFDPDDMGRAAIRGPSAVRGRPDVGRQDRHVARGRPARRPLESE